MATSPDRDIVAQQAVKLGLVTETQMQQAREELGDGNPDPEPLLRLLERKGWLTPWQSMKLLKGDYDGFFLGGYKLLYKVASGSFGRVWRAEDPTTGRVVAIKILRRRWSEDPQRIELFEREGKVGLSLRHPNIVEILAVNHDASSGQYYIVMEFVEGGNLREILQIRKKLDPAEALRILEDAVAGLAHAYARGVTHRDMKLTNILIAAQGAAKIVDFGLAGIYSGANYREDEKMERTVDYAGLEKATGVKHGDVRSDIYFLGCVLYESLTGRPPMPVTRDRYARMQKARFDSVAPMRPDEVKAPPSVFHLVDTMMALNPHHRYQTPSQLLDAVRAARRDVEGKGEVTETPKERTVFVIERDDRLQDKIRDRFKALGYRVLIAADPSRALDRFRHQPYDALLVDAGSTEEEGLLMFDRIMAEADRQGRRCVGLLVLNEDQADWKSRIKQRPTVVVFCRPELNLKQLCRKLQEMVPIAKREN
jgi:serine/threonine protein kinase